MSTQELKDSATIEWSAVANELRAAVAAMNAGTAAAPGLPFENDSNTGLFRPAANVLAVSTNGSERVRVGSAGISFDAGSNFLGHYEQGTWTPVLEGTVSNPTYTTSFVAGEYTRVGRVCHFSARINLTAYSGGSGELLITAPFSISGAANGVAVGTVFITNIGTWRSGTEYMALRAKIGTGKLSIGWQDQTSSGDLGVASMLSGTSSVFIGGTFRVTA